jgi:recombinational DNA repair ATPase RecF
MHLTELRITNFQGIEQRNILFQPPTGFLVGPNGCGKSTVLEAIRLLLIGDKRQRLSKKSL